MAAGGFPAALSRVLAHEGGYSNHPDDPGGPTNFGITIADYRRYVKADATAADIKAMRVEEVERIYRAAYWDAMRCDDLPAGLDYAAFDYGVNSGIGRAVRVLQRLVGLPDDGRMTDGVLASIGERDPSDLIAQLCDERLAFLKQLKTWPVFGAGWGRRVAEVRAAALDMVSKSATAEALPAAVGTKPAEAAAPASGDAKLTAEKRVPAQASLAMAAAAAGAALMHWASQPAAWIAAALIVALLVAGIGWLVWRRSR
ncbi:MAG TPA: glycosyl hydrolase 108 family protein [Xanthobacteraceae bacterium]|jgi:lysozyme family protein|nr:glycosyl hydrolase 108 family protein [Xanthobacteraceae bacterium]